MQTDFDSLMPRYIQTELYIRNTLKKYDISPLKRLNVHRLAEQLYPIIQEAASPQKADISISGSYAKRTAIAGSTDIDLLVRHPPSTELPLRDIYGELASALRRNRLTYREQNVSIRVMLDGAAIDLVPAKQRALLSSDLSLYVRRKRTWMKTNIQKHIALIRGSGLLNEIRAMKVWRGQKALEFPSFYLELTVMNAFKGVLGRTARMSANITRVLTYLCEEFADSRVTDPSNSNNVISDDLTQKEKLAIKAQAIISRELIRASQWELVIS